MEAGGRQKEHFSIPHLPLMFSPVDSSYTITKRTNYRVILESILRKTLTFILYKLYFTLMCLRMYVCICSRLKLYSRWLQPRTHALHTYVHSLTQLQLQMAECPLRSSRLWNGLFLHIYIVMACLTPLAAKYRIQTTTDNRNCVHYVDPFSHCPF